MGPLAPGIRFRRHLAWGVFVALAAMGASRAAAQSLSLQPVASGVGLSQPLFVTAPAGDTRLFIVEKGGIIKVQSAPGATPTPFLNLGSTGLNLVNTTGERGLLGMAFDPNYATNGRFYVNYIDRTTLDTKVARYTVSANPNVANTTGTVVLTVDQTVSVSGTPTEFTNHKAGWIGFRPADATNLYVATGDGGSSNDPGNVAQNINSNLGKILRIDVSGSGAATPAAGNPFAGATPGNDEIWAYGLRNPFRNSFDRDTGHLYIADVGQGTREEVNVEEATGVGTGTGGRNYGWRDREGSGDNPGVSGTNIPPGAVDPVFDYPRFSTFSPGSNASVTGGYVYRGSALPAIDGTYFFADYISGKIGSFIYDPVADTVSAITDRTPQLDPTGSLFGANAISSFGEDGFGELYLVDINGEVYKLIPEPGSATMALAVLGLRALRRRRSH